MFCDESDTVRVLRKNVWVYVAVRVGYSIYENLERRFLAKKKEVSPHLEVKWSHHKPHRCTFLRMVADCSAEIMYYVVVKGGNHDAERYRRKTLEVAFRTLHSGAEPVPFLVLDGRDDKQNRQEIDVMKALVRSKRLPGLPAFAYSPSHCVAGLQLADLVAGALRVYEAEGREEYYRLVRNCIRHREEIRL